jgi:hypothetical protein
MNAKRDTPNPNPHASILDMLMDSDLVGSTDLGGVPREQKMLKGHLPRVLDHRAY